MMKKLINKEDFIKMYNSGEALWKIGKTIGVSKKTVETKAKELGLSRGKGFKFNKKFSF